MYSLVVLDNMCFNREVYSETVFTKAGRSYANVTGGRELSLTGHGCVTDGAL